MTAHLFSMEFKYAVMSIQIVQSTQLPAALILVPYLFLIYMITFSIISCYIVHHVCAITCILGPKICLFLE